MNRILITLAVALTALGGAAQDAVTLDSCRAMALHGNKELRRADLAIEQAGYQRKEAHAAYLPSVDLEAAYLYNSRQLSLVDEDQLLPVKNFDLASQSYQFDVVKNPATGEPIVGPSGTYIPSQVALLPKSALTYNVHNVMGGALTVTQPIYMGGKIKAMNAITGYAEQLARAMRDSKAQDIIYNVDAAYWMVVSLKAKQRLAQSYVELVQSLDNDVRAMMEQGVATRASLLTVDVKLNEAQVDLTRVNNGLVLARMALAQVCGLPVDTPLTLADEDSDRWQDALPAAVDDSDMNSVYAARSDVQALTLATKIYDQKARVARSEMMPKVAAMAMYHITNPNSYNGFENRFGGMFTLGITVKVPLWHWGGLSSKYKAAQVEARMKQLELDDAKEKIELQVSQARFRTMEAAKTLDMTTANLAKAEENLRIAGVAFREGVSTADDVMAAQTAWLKARSEQVDAAIDVQLCNVYLSKVLGTLQAR